MGLCPTSGQDCRTPRCNGSTVPEIRWDLWLLPTEGDHKPIPYLRAPFNERCGIVSPDGRWMAYYSDESGKPEVYVQSFPTPGGKYQISTSGASAGLQLMAWVHGGQ